MRFKILTNKEDITIEAKNIDNLVKKYYTKWKKFKANIGYILEDPVTGENIIVVSEQDWNSM